MSVLTEMFSVVCVGEDGPIFFFFLPTKNDQGKPVLLSGFNLDIAHSSFNLLQTFSEFHFTDPVSLFVILYAQILQRKKSL